jgi:hypothetical protein
MKAAISKLNCAARIGLIICFNAISNAGAQSGGSIEVNEDAVAFASQLIQEGHSIADRKGAWREHKPSPDFKNVHRCGLLAVQARVRQYGYANIEKAAAELERAIKAQAGDRDGSFAFANSFVFHPCKSTALKLPAR